MDSRKISKLSLVLAALCFWAVLFLDSEAAAEETPLPDVPYDAQIIGDNVYVRCGPGTNFYRCGKMFKGEMVKVVDLQNTWAKIVPTEKNFSWISKQYVEIDKHNPDIGVVTNDDVRIYAGSEYVEPIHSDRVQLKFNKGDKVVLLGEEVGDYYKIKPPADTYFWISAQYTQPMEIVNTTIKQTEPVEIIQVVTPEAKPQTQPEPKENTTVTQAVVPATVSSQDTEISKRLKAYYILQDIVKLEFTKPLLEQDYSRSVQGLTKLIEENNTDKAAKYAQFLLGRIKRFELAAQVEKESKTQDSQLQQTIQRIKDVHSQRKAEFRDTGQYAVIGTIRKSNVYGPEKVLLHYTVVDDDEKIICYALPTGAVSMADMESFVGSKVGLVGRIEPHPQTSGALVRFKEVDKIN